MRFIKGLHRDNHPSSQPENTYRDLRNGVLDEERGAVRNEKGSSQAASISSEIKGFVNISGEEIVFFTSSDIILFDSSTDSTTTILSDVNLDIRRPIDGEWRILNNGDRVVYWTDNVNPPRRINIDSVQFYNSVSEFNLIPGTKSVPEFNLDRINDFGGNLEYGSYQIAVAYKKEDTTTTNFFYVTNPINITRTINDPNTSGSREIGGSEGKLSNKSITFSLNDLDQSYDELVIAVIKDDSVRLLPDIQINSSSVTYTVTGNESYVDGSLEEIVINNASYNKAKTMAQLGGVLYLGNVTKSQQIDYQKYANNISVEAFAENADNIAGVNNGRFDNAEDTFKIRSFRRDDVYAFYISFLLEDGSETPAYHIPGRQSTNHDEDSYAEVSLNDYSLPSNKKATAFQGLTIGIPEDSEKAYGGWDLNADSNGETTSHEVRIQFADSNGNNLFSNYAVESTTGGELASDYVDRIQTAVQQKLVDNNLDSDWECVTDTQTANPGFVIRALNAGTAYNDYRVKLYYDNTDSTNAGGAGEDWAGVTSNKSATNGSYEYDPTDFGANNSAYNDIVVYVEDETGSTLTMNIDDSSSVSTGYTQDYDGDGNQENTDTPWQGDSAAVVVDKIKQILNNDGRDQSSYQFGSFQSSFTAYLGTDSEPSGLDETFNDSDTTLYIVAENTGSEYNAADGLEIEDQLGGTNLSNDPDNDNNNEEITNIVDGYNKSEGMEITLDPVDASISGRTDDDETTNEDVVDGESEVSIISDLVVGANNNANYNYLNFEDLDGRLRIIDTEGGSDFAGNNPVIDINNTAFAYGVDSTDASVTYTVNQQWTTSSVFNEIDNSDESYLPSYAKKFHVVAKPDVDDNMGYWHNRNETYPDEEDWEVWKVQGDGTGTQKPTDGSEGEYDLAGKQVRHHRFPSRYYERAADITRSKEYDQKTSSNGNTDSPVLYETDIDTLYSIGIKVKNIQIPEKYRDRILGYRIHYARKTESNKLSSGQSKPIPVRDDAADRNQDYWGVNAPSGEKHYIFSEFDVSNPDNVLIPQGYQSDDKWNDNGNQTEDDKAYLYPFGQIKDRINLNSVKFLKNYRGLESSNPGLQIHQVEAIGYIGKNQESISLTSQGFEKDMENPMAESKIIVQSTDGAKIRRGLIDLRKYTENMFLSFDQQETVWTGYFKDLSEISKDENGDRLNENNPHTSDVIYGGDTFICKDYLKATHLFPYYKINWDGNTNSDDGYFFHGTKFENTDIEEYHELSTIACMLAGVTPVSSNTSLDYDSFVGNTSGISDLEVGNLRGTLNAMSEAGVGASNFVGAIPLPIRIIHSQVVEVEYNTYWKSQDRNDKERPYFEGDDLIGHQRPDEEFYPDVNLLEDQNGENKGLTGGRWTMDFYTEVFNSYEYNIEYNKQNNTKPAFPFSKDAVDKYRFPTRVIRSQQQVVGERDSSFRVFREEDTYDLPENRGELQKIAAFNDSLVLHMKDALFRTRGREEISVGDSRAFLGAGNIFEVEPQEITSNESGFAGIESLEHSIVTPTGYFFVEKDTNRVFQLSADGINIISKQGMRQFFLDNLNTNTNTAIGWDPHHERVMIKLDNECISYMPSLQRWVSFHDLDPVFLFNTDNRLLYADDVDDVYRYGTGTTRNMDISFVDISEDGQNKRISAVMLDTVVIDGSSEDVDNTFDQISIENEYQSMPLKDIIYFATQGSPYGKNKSYYDQDTIADTEVPARKQRGLWKINRLRDESLLPLSASEQIYGSEDWKYKKRFKDQYHTITLKFTEAGKEIELIRAFVAGPTSKR